jgi:hypothetical protein
MKLGDYLTKRVVAWLVIAALSALFGIARAEAACTLQSTRTWQCVTYSEAFAMMQANPVSEEFWMSGGCHSGFPRNQAIFIDYGGSGSVQVRYNCQGDVQASSNAYAVASYTTNNCALEDYTHTNWAPPSVGETDPKRCYEGCVYEPFAPTSGFPSGGWANNGDRCTVGEPPIIDTDGDGTPDVDDAFPNDSGETTDSDGDGIGDNADVAPNDPNNGQDGSQPPAPPPDPGDCGGAGQPPCERPGDESDNVSTGGGTCDAPPACSGDGIQCNQLFQQWKMRCAAEGLLAQGEDGDGDGDGNEPGAPGSVPSAQSLYEPTGDTPSTVYADFKTRVMDSPLINAATGFFNADGLSGTCPTFTLTMFGRSIALDFFCMAEFQQIFVWLSWFVLASFTWYAFKIGFLD